MADLLIDEIVKHGSLLKGSNDEAARLGIINAATKLIQSLENPGEQLARIGWGEPSRTAALRAAFELGLLAKLSEQPLNSAQLVADTKADPELVSRIMKHLAANGVVKEVGKDQYCATLFSMASKGPAISGGLIYSFEGMIPTFHSLPELLARTDYQVPRNAENGPVQFGLKSEKPFFAILKENARLGSAFNNFMNAYAEVRPRWVDYYPCQQNLLDGASENGPLLVDIGGGLGRDVTSFNEKFPGWSSRLVLEDTPKVISEVQSSASELSTSIKLVSHDFFEPQPTEYRGARAYFLRLVLHDWPDDQCKIILSNIRDAMKAGYSRILINENVLSDVDTPWQQTSLDWTMMGMLVSQERTESKWQELLRSAGLKINGIWRKDPASESVIEAILADD